MIADAARRRGLTLIEVLVVVAVIGVLAALLLMAVQQAREAERRSRCSDHLRQVGLALNAFVSRNESFPSPNSGPMLSFYVPLLPYLEQATLYDAINVKGDRPGVAPENDTVSRVSLEVLLCPSDRPPTTGLGWTSYAGNRGVCERRPPPLMRVYDGAFGKEPTAPRDIADGLSHTAAVSEWLFGLPPNGRDARRTIFRTALASLEPNWSHELRRECHDLNINNAMIFGNDKGVLWILGEFRHTLYNHLMPINGRSCVSGGSTQFGAYSAGSLHPGGANVLFADGHVRFLRDSVDPATWLALGTRGGGEVVNGSF